MNKNYEDWLKYYENATKEQVIEDMMLDINNIKEKDKEIERLNHECDTYLKIATKRKNIIDELEKLIDSYKLGKYDYEIPVVILKERLKELKEKNK